MEDQNQNDLNIVLKGLKLSNFKCFSEEIYIEHFDLLTGIVGPNGIGKSTLIQAIVFCFCKDILFDKKLFDYDDLKSNNTNRKNIKVSIDIQEDNKIIKFERNLNSKNISEFKIDNETQTQQNYCEKINLMNLSPFIILQQDEKDLFTSMNSNELMNYFEVVSGSVQYKKLFIKLSKKLNKIEEQILEQNDYIRSLKKNRRNALFIINSNQKAKQMIKDVEELEKNLFQLKIFEFKQKEENIQNKIQVHQEQLKLFYKDLDKYSSEIQNQKKSDIRLEREQLIKKFQDFIEHKLSLDEKKNELTRISKELQNDLLIHQKDLNNHYFPKLKIQEEKLNDIEQQIQNLENEKFELQNSFKNKTNIKLNKNQEKKLKLLLLKEQDLVQQQDNNLKQIQSIDTMAENILKLKSILNKIDFEIQQNQKLLTLKSNDELDLQQEQKLLHQEEEQISDQTKQNLEIQQKQQQIKDRIRQLELQIQIKQTNSYSNKNNEEILKILSRIDGFEGKVSDLISPLEKKYSLAIAMSLNSILDYYVVRDIQTSFQVSQILKSRQIIKNVIILENAPKLDKQELAHKRKLLTEGEYLTYDLIDFPKYSTSFHDYIVHYLRSTVICENFQQALKLKKNSNAFNNIVTIDGELIKDDGIESYGNKFHFPKKIQNFLQNQDNQQEELQQQLLEQQRELQDLESQSFKKLDNLSLYQRKINIQERQNQLEQFIKNLKHQIKSNKSEQKLLQTNLEQKEIEFQNQRKENQDLQNFIQMQENDFFKLMNDLANDININHDQIQSLLCSKKNKEFEMINIDNKISNLQIEKKDFDLDQINEKIEEIQNIIQKKQDEINYIDNKLQKISQKFNSIKDQEDNFKNEQQQIEQKEKDQNNNKEDIRRQIIIIENSLDKEKIQQQQQYKNLQKNNIELQNYIKQEELKGRNLNESFKKDLQTIRTQINQEIENQFEILFTKEFYQKIKQESQEQLQQRIKQLNNEKNTMQNKLNQYTVNLINDDFLKQEEERIKDIKQELQEKKEQTENLINQEKDLQQQLKENSDKRESLLKNFIDPLITLINKSYKFVNCDDRSQANFIIENPFQYFSKGIIYTAIPPEKTFTIGTESLSTGESSFANLALFLAINEVLKSPVIILDEIDANLDALNLSKLISSYQKYSQQKQLIFISHKPQVYRHAQTLLGFTKHEKKDTAIYFYLDLKNYQKTIEQQIQLFQQIFHCYIILLQSLFYSIFTINFFIQIQILNFFQFFLLNFFIFYFFKFNILLTLFFLLNIIIKFF